MDDLFAAIDSPANSESRKQARESIGELTKRTKTTLYACESLCRLSREYDNTASVRIFIRQGIIAERINKGKCKEKKKPFFMEYFGL